MRCSTTICASGMDQSISLSYYDIPTYDMLYQKMCLYHKPNNSNTNNQLRNHEAYLGSSRLACEWKISHNTNIGFCHTAEDYSIMGIIETNNTSRHNNLKTVNINIHWQRSCS